MTEEIGPHVHTRPQTSYCNYKFIGTLFHDKTIHKQVIILGQIRWGKR